MSDDNSAQVFTSAIFDDLWPEISNTPRQFVFKKDAFEIKNDPEKEYFIIAPIIKNNTLDIN